MSPVWSLESFIKNKCLRLRFLCCALAIGWLSIDLWTVSACIEQVSVRAAMGRVLIFNHTLTLWCPLLLISVSVSVFLTHSLARTCKHTNRGWCCQWRRTGVYSAINWVSGVRAPGWLAVCTQANIIIIFTVYRNPTCRQGQEAKLNERAICCWDFGVFFPPNWVNRTWFRNSVNLCSCFSFRILNLSWL